jgi:hypothetical protein
MKETIIQKLDDLINKVESTECINGRVDNDLIDLLESAVNHIVDLESELEQLKRTEKAA